MTKNIVVIEGDGIGPEVTRQAVKVLRAIAERFNHEFSTTNRAPKRTHGPAACLCHDGRRLDHIRSRPPAIRLGFRRRAGIKSSACGEPDFVTRRNGAARVEVARA